MVVDDGNWEENKLPLPGGQSGEPRKGSGLGAVLLTRGSTPAGPQPLSQEDVIACTFDGISLVEDIIAVVQDKSDEWTRQLTALIPRPR